MTATHNAMACPIDGTALVMSERQGIEIDYCPACRGVWLDRGELDKIIERGRDDRPGQTAAQAADPGRTAATSGAATTATSDASPSSRTCSTEIRWEGAHRRLFPS